MSPATYTHRLQRIFKDMSELYDAGNSNPLLARSLVHLHRACRMMKGKTTEICSRSRFNFGHGHRDYVNRAVMLLSEKGRPLTVRQILDGLQQRYPELRDVTYLCFYPTIRGEVAGERKRTRKLAECGIDGNHKLYGLPDWKSAIKYIPCLKHDFAIHVPTARVRKASR